MNTFTLTGTFKDINNNPIYVGRYVKFRVTGAGTDTDTSTVYPRQTFSFVVQSDGTLAPENSGDTMELWVNGDSGVQSYYRIYLPSREVVDVVLPSAVDGTTADLSTIIESYQVDGSTQQSSTLADAKAYTNVLADDPTNNTSFDAANWKAGLGLEIGTDVQAYDAGLADISGLAVTNGNIIVGDGTNWVAESGETARTSLGLGQFYDSGTSGKIKGGSGIGSSLWTVASNSASFQAGTLGGGTLLSIEDFFLSSSSAKLELTANSETSRFQWNGGDLLLEINAPTSSSIELQINDVPQLTIDESTVSIAGDLDMQAGVITLDADGDTSITADTDDQIDFQVGGVDVARIDAEGLVTSDAKSLTSAGLTLSNSGGTTVATLGAGGGTGATFAGGVNVTGQLAVTGDTIIATETPASASASGTAGQVAWDADYIYICTATDTWKRVAIATW
jgi:hypothetical protein